MKKRYISALIGLTTSMLYMGADLSGFMPPEKIDAFTQFGMRSLFVSGKGKTTAQWLLHDRRSFSCVFEDSTYGHYCGFDIRVGDGREKGKDLSEFSHLRLKFDLQGDGRCVRINFRNAFDDISVARNGKQHDIQKPVKEGLNEFYIPLDTFTIPQYWLDKHPGLDESYLSQERDNVTHMGLFYEEPNKKGNHRFTIEEFEVVNQRQYIINKVAYILFPFILLISAVMLVRECFSLRPRTVLIEPNDQDDIRLECEELLKGQISELGAYDLTTGLLSREMTTRLLQRYAQNYALDNIFIMAVSLDNYSQIQMQYGDDVAKEYRLAASIAVKFSVNKMGVVCSWYDAQLLVLLPQSMALYEKKIKDGIRREASVEKFSQHGLPLVLSVYVGSITEFNEIYTAFNRPAEDV